MVHHLSGHSLCRDVCSLMSQQQNQIKTSLKSLDFSDIAQDFLKAVSVETL